MEILGSVETTAERRKLIVLSEEYDANNVGGKSKSISENKLGGADDDDDGDGNWSNHGRAHDSGSYGGSHHTYRNNERPRDPHQ